MPRKARGTRPLPGVRQSALTRAGSEPTRLRGRLADACREHQRACLWGRGRSVAAVAAFSRHGARPLTPGGRSLREQRKVVRTRKIVCTVRTSFWQGENPVTSDYTSGGDLVDHTSHKAPLREHCHHPG